MEIIWLPFIMALVMWLLLKWVVSDNIQHASYNNRVMTVTRKSGKIYQYEGSGTVWYELPLMKRCPTYIESELNDIHVYIRKYGNSYPEAHTKQHETKL
jgi:hypothetical protein